MFGRRWEAGRHLVRSTASGKQRTAPSPTLALKVKAVLAEAEEAAKAGKARRQEELWGTRVQKTQTESAFRTGCL